MYICLDVLVIIQVKYDLTKAFTGDDDKETIHCEFDVTGGNIEWLSGQIFVNFFLFIIRYISKIDSTKVLCPPVNEIEILIPGDSPSVFLSLDKM